MLVDTGASETILSAKMYHLIPRHKRPPLESPVTEMKQADGSNVEILGTTVVELAVGKVRQVVKLVVANINNDGLLGMDFLTATGGTLNLANGTLEIGGEIIPCRRYGGSHCYRVVATETVMVPPEHEQIILARASRFPDDTMGLVEPLERGLLQSKGLNVARAIVGTDEIIPVRVMNVHPTSRVVKRGMCVATVTPVVEDEIFCSREDSEEQDIPEIQIPDHIKDLVEQTVAGIPPKYREQVRQLLYEYSDVFSSGTYDLGRTARIKHLIHSGKAIPHREPPRRKPPEQRVEIERQVQALLKEGLISRSNSPWSSPIVLVAKKDGSQRLCVDYRKLNQVTTKDAYPLPRIDESLDALGGAKWFSTLDMASGYWQVELDEDAAKKSAFSTSSGLYEWKVLPFGLCNAPSTFERLMESVLSGLHWEILLIYLDDVIVFAQTIEEMTYRLRTVFQRFRDANLKLKPSKCTLYRQEVQYLGHLVTVHGIHTDPEKTKVIDEWPTPRSQTEVRSFIGIAQYYRRFIEGFGKIAHPLYRLMEKKAVFRWTPECDDAFKILKNRLTSAPILAFPTIDDSFVLDTDASGFAMGAVLSQIQDGEERVIAYGSKSFKKEERNYCTTRRELLSIITFLKKFRHYLLGRVVKVRTDHSSLRWLMNFKDADGQLARWREVCAQYQLQIEHRPGKSHQNADCLSRMPCKQCGRKDQGKNDVKQAQIDHNSVGIQCEIPYQTYNVDIEIDQVNKTQNLHEHSANQRHPDQIEDHHQRQAANEARKSEPSTWAPQRDLASPSGCINVVTVEPEVSLAKIREEQLKDESMSRLLHWIESVAPRPTWEDISPAPPALKTYWALWPLLEVRGGILTRRWEDGDGKAVKWLTVLPAGLRSTVLQELHASKTAGHMGVNKTVAKVKAKYYWVRLAADVRAYIRQCTTCARRKQPVPRKKAPLRQYQIGGPMERIALDIMGPLPESENGNKYVLVIGDYWTKWVEAYPIPDQTVETVADKLVKEFCFRYGFPLAIHSDQGRNFESQVFKEACKLFGIEKTRTTAYNPKSDGLIERFNRTILNAVSVMIELLQHQRDWDNYLSYFGFAYRSCVQETTQETPNNMMFGREVRCPLDLMVEGPPHEEDCTTDYVADLRENLRGIHERVRHVLKLSTRRQKRNYNRKTKDPEYQVGDFVWLYNHQRKPGMCRKLTLPWEGPYMITTKLCDVVYRIQRTPRCKPKVVHADRLKIYQGPPLRPWKTVAKPDTQENNVDVPVERHDHVERQGAPGAGVSGSGDIENPEIRDVAGPESTDKENPEVGRSDDVLESENEERVEDRIVELTKPGGNTLQKERKHADKNRGDGNDWLINLPGGLTLPRSDPVDEDDQKVRRNPPRERRIPARYL